MSNPLPAFDAGILLAGSVVTGDGSRDDWRESVLAGDFIYFIPENEMTVINQ